MPFDINEYENELSATVSLFAGRLNVKYRPNVVATLEEEAIIQGGNPVEGADVLAQVLERRIVSWDMTDKTRDGDDKTVPLTRKDILTVNGKVLRAIFDAMNEDQAPSEKKGKR